MLSDYRLLSFNDPLPVNNNGNKQRFITNARTGSYVFKNTVRLISINSAVVEKYFGIHNLSDYKLRKVKQSLETVMTVDLEALCFRGVPSECILL